MILWIDQVVLAGSSGELLTRSLCSSVCMQCVVCVWCMVCVRVVYVCVVCMCVWCVCVCVRVSPISCMSFLTEW